MLKVKFPALVNIAPMVMAIVARNDKGMGAVRYVSPSPESPYYTIEADISQVVISCNVFSVGQEKFPVVWECAGAALIVEGGHIGSYSGSEIVIVAGPGENARYVPPPPPRESGMFPEKSAGLSQRFSHRPPYLEGEQ